MKGAYRPALYRYYVLMGLRHTHNARAKKEHQQEKKGNKRFQSVFAHSSLYACSALSVTEIIFFQTERDLTRRRKRMEWTEMLIWLVTITSAQTDEYHYIRIMLRIHLKLVKHYSNIIPYQSKGGQIDIKCRTSGSR